MADQAALTALKESQKLLEELKAARAQAISNGRPAHPAIDQAILDQERIVESRQRAIDAPPSAFNEGPLLPVPSATAQDAANPVFRRQKIYPPQRPLPTKVEVPQAHPAIPEATTRAVPETVIAFYGPELAGYIGQAAGNMTLPAAPAPSPMPAPTPVAATVPADPWAKFKPVAATAAAAPEKPLAWSDVPGKALENIPSSAGKFAQSIVHPIMHPIDTLAAFRDIGTGLVSKVYGAAGGPQDPAKKAEMEKAADAVGKFFADRYGSVEGFKKALATDPVGIMADASIVLTGGGAALARAPGAVGQAGQAVRAAGSAIDPIANAGRMARAGGTAAIEALGVSTGAGARPIREAITAGEHGNPVFLEHMRGQRPMGEVVDMAERGVEQMGRDRSAAYTAGMQSTRASQQAVNFQPVYDAIQTARDEVRHQGVVVDRTAAGVVDDMQRIVDEFANLPTPPTPETFDAMKRAVGAIYDRAGHGTNERRVAGSIYNTVRNEITAQVPEYAAAMRDYANASEQIGEARRTLSVNPNATTDTTLRKLQSTMRNNVNTNFGERERMLDVLAQHEPNLPPAIAGQTLNTVAPRGLARVTPGMVMAGGLSTMNPMAVAALPFTSPRLVGEAAYAFGRGAGGLMTAANNVGLTPNLMADALRSAYIANAMTGGQ